MTSESFVIARYVGLFQLDQKQESFPPHTDQRFYTCEGFIIPNFKDLLETSGHKL